jgi:hypothetical protein
MDFALNVRGKVVRLINEWEGDAQPLVHDYPLNFILPVVFLVPYIIMVFWGPSLMKDKAPWKIPRILAVWNWFLWVFSVLMLLGVLFPLLNFLWEMRYNHPVYHLLCQPKKRLVRGGPAVFWVYLFCMSKYLELGDTFFLVVRKRPIIFLHWYHHVTVLLYCWFSIGIVNPGASVFALVNVIVHSFMYWYYFKAAIGKRPSWGFYLTLGQLGQMVLGIFVSALWAYYYYDPDSACSAKHPSLIISSSFIMYGSYFLLFLNFFLQRYLGFSLIQYGTKKPSEDKKKTK